MDIQWLQATFPSAAGGLGFITEKILLFGRADLIYVEAYRAVAPLIEILIPLRLEPSRIDWISILLRFAQIFLIWHDKFEN